MFEAGYEEIDNKYHVVHLAKRQRRRRYLMYGGPIGATRQHAITSTCPSLAQAMILRSRVTIGMPRWRAVVTIKRSPGSPCRSPGRNEASIAISVVRGASLIAGPAITRANQVFGSGINRTAVVRPALGLLSRPTSQAETGETKTPSARPAPTIAAAAEPASGSPLASQITAQVSNSTARGNRPSLTDGAHPPRRQRLPLPRALSDRPPAE